MNIKDLTQEFLRECFAYNPDTGVLKWVERPINHFADERACKAFNTRFAGQATGSMRRGKGNRRYLNVGLAGKTYLSHRIIWMHQFGVWPNQIDHLNGDQKDNRLCNIRSATPTENARNCFLSQRSVTGHAGVSVVKSTGRFRAHIGVAGGSVMLGNFHTIDEAIAARGGAETVLEFSDRHGEARYDFKD